MPNAVYEKFGTAIVFGSEGGDDVDWSTENISSGAGRQSAQADLVALTTARATRYRVRFWTQLQATPTFGRAVQLFAKTSDGSHPLNDDGTGDAALSDEDKLANLLFIGTIVVDEAAANVEMVLEAEIVLRERYVQLVLYNDSGAAITNDAAETKAELIPVYDEIQ